ncbi:uncharacterized protein LOC100679561 isoform X1 [Nasonia vitripennis]|uniref:Uncharacterized protein n=2 Tax=Nasonia vitripennis TaxID=7425 RepID=A0A7M7M1N3_NASVI|nr:uncharacterized protein LOC100679561 isoform X1 [Nasonia vitripennis]
MFRASLLLLAFSIVSRDCALIPGIPNSGNVGFQLDPERRDAQFGEGIRDWFKNMKNKLGFGNKDTSKQVELPNPFDLNSSPNLKLYQASESPSDRLVIQPGNFFLDLSNVKFDPDRDWGFRVSNWYVIRKAPTTEPPFYTNKPIEEWANWNEYSSSSVEDVIKLGPKDQVKPKPTEPSSFTTGTIFRSTIPEMTTPRTTSALPETTMMSKKKTASAEKKESSENSVVVMPVQDLSVEILRPTA